MSLDRFDLFPPTPSRLEQMTTLCDTALRGWGGTLRENHAVLSRAIRAIDRGDTKAARAALIEYRTRGALPTKRRHRR